MESSKVFFVAQLGSGEAAAETFCHAVSLTCFVFNTNIFGHQKKSPTR